MKKKPPANPPRPDLPACEIVWNSLGVPAWRDIFGQCRRAPLTQSYDYARAVCSLYNQNARWGLITIEGKTAGLAQMQEAGIFKNLIHGLVFDRGPVWLPGFGTKAHQKAFFHRLAHVFPRRFGRRRRILPEIGKDKDMVGFLEDQGFRRKDVPGYKTIWLDITDDRETLRKNLHKKWRNALSKSERSGLEIEWDTTGQYLPWLLDVYRQDKKEKGYDGPSRGLIRALSRTFIPAENFIIGRGLIENRAVAAIILLCHGSSATYQIGWINDDGKRVNAHNLLLWRGLGVLKEKGIKDFDLGGVNDTDAKGVKKFKSRMGGDPVTLVGHYS